MAKRNLLFPLLQSIRLNGFIGCKSLRPGMLLLVLMLLAGWKATAQSDSDRAFSAAFAMDSMVFEPGDLQLSNTLKLVNNGPNVLKVRPELILPSGWTLIFALPETITVQAGGQSFFFPVELFPQGSAQGGQAYPVQLVLRDEQGNVTASAGFSVRFPVLHSCRATLQESKFFLSASKKRQSLTLNVSNDGNVAEQLFLQLPMHPNLIFESAFKKGVFLAPGQDTAIQIEFTYLPVQDKIQEISLPLSVFNESKTVYRKITLPFEVLENEYDFQSASRKNNFLELSPLYTSQAERPQLGFRMGGVIPIMEEGRVDYRLGVADLLNSKSLTDLSGLFISYSDSSFQAGFNNYELRSRYTQHLNQPKEWYVEVQHQLKTNTSDLNVEKNLLVHDDAYSGLINVQRNPEASGVSVNALFQAQWHFGAKHQLTGVLDDSYLNKGGQNAYTAHGFRYRLDYIWRPSSRMEAAVSSQYGSPKYLRGGQSTLENLFKFNFRDLKGRHILLLDYQWNQKSPKAYAEGNELPFFSYAYHRMQAQYTASIRSGFRFNFRTKWEMYASEKYASLADANLAYDRQSLEYGAGIYYRRWFQLDIKQKRTQIQDFVAPESLFAFQNIPGFTDWQGTLTIRKERIAAVYQYNQTADISRYLANNQAEQPVSVVQQQLEAVWTTTHFRLGGRYLDDDQTGRQAGIQLHYLARLDRFKMQVQLDGSATAKLEGSEEWSVAAQPALLWNFAPGWLLQTKVQVAFEERKPNAEASAVQTQNSQWQATLRKDFYAAIDKTPNRSLEVACFKDLNGNGQWDAGEEGVSDIRLELNAASSDSVAALLAKGKRFEGATVYTSADGHAAFSRLPAQAYRLEVQQLFSNSDGFFNSAGQTQEIELNNNQKLLIPFRKGQTIEGQVVIRRDENSSHGALPLSGIRITAVDSQGKKFETLTNKKGQFVLTVPYSSGYTLSMNNPYGKDFELLKPAFQVDLDQQPLAPIEFVIKEKAVEIEWN